jgi:hypothetical protein
MPSRQYVRAPARDLLGLPHVLRKYPAAAYLVRQGEKPGICPILLDAARQIVAIHFPGADRRCDDPNRRSRQPDDQGALQTHAYCPERQGDHIDQLGLLKAIAEFNSDYLPQYQQKIFGRAFTGRMYALLPPNPRCRA